MRRLVQVGRWQRICRSAWLRPLVVLALAAGLCAFHGMTARAMDDAQLQTMLNGSVHFNLKDCTANGDGNGDAVTGGLAGGNGAQNEAPIHDYLKGKGFTGAQIAGIMGNLYVESAGFQTGAADPHGAIGLAQWQGPRRTALESYAASKGKPVDDLITQLDFLMHELSTNYKSVIPKMQAVAQDPHASEQAWETNFEGCSLCHHDRRIAETDYIFNKYGGAGGGGDGNIQLEGGLFGGPAAGGDDATDCAQAKTGGNGDIAKTVLGLVWPFPKNSRTESTPAYVDAIAKYNGGGDQTDCGRFVATVMHMSGLDPQFPQVGTTIQDTYLHAHPEKYDIIPAPKDLGQLQAGDILNMDGHTEFFMGDLGGGRNSAGASLDGSTPGHTPQQNGPGEMTWVLRQPGLFAARFKGGNAAGTVQ